MLIRNVRARPILFLFAVTLNVVLLVRLKTQVFDKLLEEYRKRKFYESPYIMDFTDGDWDYKAHKLMENSSLRTNKTYTVPGTTGHSLAEVKSQYSKLYGGRLPPPGFSAWHAFATERRCFTDLTLYSQIEKDLKIWRDRGGIRAEDIPNEKLPKNSAVHYDSAEKKFVGGPGAYLSNLPVLDVIAHIFSDEVDFADEKWNEKQRDFAFQIGATDEPRLVPADNGPESVTYKSMDDLFANSQCFREKFDTMNRNFSDRLTARRLHGFLQKPDSFVAINLDTPMFSQAKMDCYADMLMPLWYHTRIAYEQVKDVIPWAEKHNALFWRGSSTGGSYRTDSPWTTFHRTRLMEWESQRRLKYPQSVFDASKEDPLNDPSSPVPVDVAFNAYVQTDDATRRILEIMYPLKPGVWNSRAMQFKYLLVVDGNSWSGRIQTYLESNSVVLWSGLFVDWYLTSLKPWVHYVPVKLDFSDLDERLEWLRNHDDEAQQISKNARLLMGQMGRISQIQCYTALLLLEYRSLWGLPGAQSPEEFRNEVPTV